MSCAAPTFARPPTIAIRSSPGPKVVTAAPAFHGDRDEEKWPGADIDRGSARLRRNGDCRRERVPEDAEGEHAEQERLQIPHATLPSPPTTVSASAWAANGQPPSATAGLPGEPASDDNHQPEHGNDQWPSKGDERTPRWRDLRVEDVRPSAVEHERARDATQESGMRGLMEPETEPCPETDEKRHHEPLADDQRKVDGQDRRQDRDDDHAWDECGEATRDGTRNAARIEGLASCDRRREGADRR